MIASDFTSWVILLRGPAGLESSPLRGCGAASDRTFLGRTMRELFRVLKRGGALLAIREHVVRIAKLKSVLDELQQMAEYLLSDDTPFDGGPNAPEWDERP